MQVVRSNGRRLIVNMNDLREYDASLAKGCIDEPTEYVPPFEKALNDVAVNLRDRFGAQQEEEDEADMDEDDGDGRRKRLPKAQAMSDHPLHVGFEGSFGEHYVNPRSLQARLLGKMICIEGIVTRCSLVRPKVRRSVHHCEKTHLFHTREYRDATMLGAPTAANVYPQEVNTLFSREKIVY